jgi:hypothetical protein
MLMPDLIAYIQNEFDALWNTHNTDAVMQCFADDSVVKPTPPLPGTPEAFHGKEQIRGFVQMLILNFYVDSQDFKQNGDHVTWRATITSGTIRQLGVDSLSADCEAIVQNGKIKLFAPTFTAETLAQLQAAAQTVRGL